MTAQLTVYDTLGIKTEANHVEGCCPPFIAVYVNGVTPQAEVGVCFYVRYDEDVERIVDNLRLLADRIEDLDRRYGVIERPRVPGSPMEEAQWERGGDARDPRSL